MRGFFKGWRRKVGCVTLVMAVSMMLLWARSIFFIEFVAVDLGNWTHIFVSDNGKILWWRYIGCHDMPHFGGGIVRENDNYLVLTGWAPPEANAMGLVLANAAAIPYWLGTWACTLLAAYLILWKPQKRKVESDA